MTEGIIPHCNYLFGNEDEIAHFAKLHGALPENFENTEIQYCEMLEKLHSKLKFKKDNVNIICTRGSQSVVVLSYTPKEEIIYTVPVE